MQNGNDISNFILSASGGTVDGVYIPSPKTYIAQLKYFQRL